jgi:hypothetical protein
MEMNQAARRRLCFSNKEGTTILRLLLPLNGNWIEDSGFEKS